MMKVTTQEYDYTIFYIICLQYFLYKYINMSPQPEDGGSILSLYRKAVNENLYWKAVNEAVENGLIKIFVNWSWEGLNKSELKHLTQLKSELILEN
jgi:hypothetical protein